MHTGNILDCTAKKPLLARLVWNQYWLLLRLLLFDYSVFDFVSSQQAEHQVIDVVPAASAHVHQEAAQQLPEEKQERAGSHAVQPVLPEAQLRTQTDKGQMLKHINFWHEDELKMAHPEVQVLSLFHAIHTVAHFLLHSTHHVLSAFLDSRFFGLADQHIGLQHPSHPLYPIPCQNGMLHIDNVATSCFAATFITLVSLWGPRGAPLCSNHHTSPQFSTSSTSIQAEKKMEQKRRGNKDTQTSDAKFDEQFKLGHQMASQVHIP